MTDEEILEDWRCDYENGDRRALIRAIGLCCGSREKPLPDWVLHYLFMAHFRFEIGQLKSWEDVFGKPFPKTRQRTIKETLGYTVWQRVRDHAEPIPAAFEYVADELKAEGYKIGGASTVRDLYYYMENGGWSDEN
jgi:hypothetical protein